MIITTTESIPNQEIETAIGLVKGAAYVTRYTNHGYLAGLKTLMGGELEEYTRVQDQIRDEAIRRMTKNAEEMGADAIIAVRLTSTIIMEHVAELVAYGTAVKLL